MVSGFVAKILVNEGAEVPTGTVCASFDVSVETICGSFRSALTAIVLSTAQPVMVTVEEEEDIAAFSVSPHNLLLSYFCMAVRSEHFPD